MNIFGWSIQGCSNLRCDDSTMPKRDQMFPNKIVFCRDVSDFKQNWHCALLWKRFAGVCGRSLCQFALLNQLKPNVIDMDFSLSNWLLRPPKQLLPSTISLSIQWQIEQKNKYVLVSFPEFFVTTKASVVNFELSSVWPRLWDLGQILLKRNS